MSGTDDDFLLGLAGVSGTMLGTFIVGVFFYIDSEMHRRLAASEAADRYLRSSVRWVFTAYSIPLLVPLVLASLDPLWGALSFIVLGITWFQLPLLIQTSILWLGWPVLYVVTVSQTIVMISKLIRRQHGYKV